MKNFNPVRGCFDYAPQEAKLRETVRQKILSVYENNGYNLIDTPILENLEFLNSSDGGDNLRLMFKTVKRGDKLEEVLSRPNLSENDLAEEGLRYDLTVPLSRFFAANREKLPLPFKSIQIGNVFRAERPQKGRLRQFVQCDVDVFGDASINAELELLKTVLEAYSALGFKGLTVRINHRQILNAVVQFAGFAAQDVATICLTLDKLDKISASGVALELVEKGFEMENINKLMDIVADITAKGITSLANYGADSAVVNDVEFLINSLTALTNGQHKIVFDLTIVRGQGYYTGTIFEVFCEGFSHAIGGGGRYDKMLEKFSGTSCPAVGFGLGFEPVVTLCKEMMLKQENQNLALVYDATDDILQVFKIKDELKNKFNVSLFLRPKNMKSFYEKISTLAGYTTSVADYLSGKEIKKLG